MRRNGLLKWRSHTDYERLCAKVAYGGAAEAEFIDLIEHLRTCADCRTLLIDFTRIIANILPQIAERGGAELFDVDLNGQDHTKDRRSVSTAKLMSTPNWRRWSPILAWCAPVFVCVALITSYVRLQKHNHAHSATTPEISSSYVEENAQKREPEVTVPATAKQLQQLQAALVRVGKLELALKTANQATADHESEKAQLQARVDADAQIIAEAKAIREEQRSAMAHLEQQIAEQDTAIKSRDAELVNERGRLAEISGQLNHQREITVSLTKVQELIAARHFHLVDVPPLQPVKSRTPAFGRILYAEGKELMFYGYDLAGSGEFGNATFHVWGDRIGTGSVPASLGVFTTDDKADSRWRLTFGDASILAHMDRIFVTAESTAQAVNKPKGKTVLIAYLGGQPNHP